MSFVVSQCSLKDLSRVISDLSMPNAARNYYNDDRVRRETEVAPEPFQVPRRRKNTWPTENHKLHLP